MDKFRNTLRLRLVTLSLYTLALIIAAVKSVVHPSAGESEMVRMFMLGLNAGLFASVMVMMVTAMLKYSRALKDAEKRKALYIYENDERRLYIRAKVGGDAMQLVLMGLAVATVVAEYYSQTVFFTLLSVLLFAVAIKAVFKLVYSRKLG